MARTRSLFAVTVCALALAGLGAAPALAGEITGNGTPKAVHGKSECAFSGRNDEYFLPTTDPNYQPERVQSWGQIVRTFAPVAGGGAGVPGFACNPTRAAG